MSIRNDIRYRPASLRDAPNLQMHNVEIFGANKEYDPNYRFGWEKLTDAHTFFNDLCTRKSGTCILAENDSQLVGYVGVLVHPAQCWKRATVEIDQLGVMPKYRRQGIGHQLLSFGERWAIDRGFSNIWINPYSANRNAVDLYEYDGYQTIELIMIKKLENEKS